MIEVQLPPAYAGAGARRLPYYLALEEWVADNLPADDYIFCWRVHPTVICGRNQDMPLEVNLPWCRERGIDVVRRRSGGGCVYADMNNYMFSFITPGTAAEANFARYAEATAEMLRSLGVDASVSGRNDILAGGSKIAGNAFYLHNGRSIAHGTLLFDVDTEAMTHAITPSRAKLQSKSVQSAPRRVTCLRSLGIDMDVEAFGRYAMQHYAGGRAIVLTPGQAKEVEAIEQRYYDTAFLYGRQRGSADGLVRRFRRIEGAGEFYAEIALTPGGTIESVVLGGDFFFRADVAEAIENPLRGVPYTREAIAEALRGIDTAAIKGLTPEGLLDILI